jgi:hypothetical protein
MRETLRRRWYGVFVPLVAVAVLLAVFIPGSAAAAGTGTITGTIANASGAGLAGVVVTVDYATGGSYQVSGTPVTGVTNASGVYTITNVPNGSYVLYVDPSADSNGVPYAADYYGTTAGSAGSEDPANATVVTVNSTTPVTANQSVTTGAELTGTVSDATSKDALTDADVFLYSAGGQFVNETTLSSTGTYTFSGLLSGTYSVLLAANGGTNETQYEDTINSDLVTDPTDVWDGSSGLSVSQPTGTGYSLSTGGTTAVPGNVALPAPTSISGTVTTGGNPAPNASVELYDTSGNPIDDGGAVTGTDGTYTIGGLLPGSYKVGFLNNFNLAFQYYNNVSTLSGATTLSPTAAVPSTGINATLVVGGSITGTVVNSAKAAVPGVEVDLLDASGNVLDDTATQADGSYTLAGIPTGSYYVEFISEGNFTPQLQDQYYPGSQTQGSATAVAVTAGKATPNIDAELLPITTGSQTTTVVNTTTTTVATPIPTIAGSVPTISGTAKVGYTLTAKTGVWTAGTTFRYQWYASGRAITGATSATFKLAAAEYRTAIQVIVTGAESGFYSTIATSAGTKAVVAGTLTTRVPTIAGTKKVGDRLTAKPGIWTAGTKFTYQWYANGKAIKGATKSTFRLVAAEQGKRITVRVTGKLTGYVTVAKTSRATAKVS